MKIIAALLFIAFSAFSQTGQKWPAIDKNLESEIKAVMKIETDLVLSSDIAGMKRFYPDDMVTYNPFNQIIDKAKVLERVQANIIKYTSYEKTSSIFTHSMGLSWSWERRL